jgi:hypothetical protein
MVALTADDLGSVSELWLSADRVHVPLRVIALSASASSPAPPVVTDRAVPDLNM